MSRDELNAAKQALGVQTDKELAEILGVTIPSINNYRIRGIPQKLRTLIAEKKLEASVMANEKTKNAEHEVYINELNAAKQALGVQTDKELAEILGVGIPSINHYRVRGIPQKLRTLIAEKRLENQKEEVNMETDDFKGLVEEMKNFYGVSSLEAVAEKMGYGRNIAMGWRRNKKLSAHAQLKWLEAKGDRGEITENFDELTREMQAFYGVSSLEAVAEKMGYHPHNAIKWRANNKLTTHAQLKWLEAKQNQKTGEETMSTTRNVRIFNAGETLSFAPLLSFYGCQTLKELAQKMGFAPQNADKWALDDNVPQYVLLKFEIDKRCANGQPIGDAIQAVMQAKTICVRYFPELSISAGYGIATSDSVGIQVELQQILLDGLGICNKELLDILTVCGDSMLPILQDGDRVLVERNCAARNGDCVVAVIENELVVKELERHPLGHWVRLHSKNEKYRDIELEGQEVEKMRIVGIVRAIIRTMGRKV